MAFKPQSLHVLAYARGFTLWHTATDDPADAVIGDGYFDDASELFRRGDVILANMGGGETPAFAMLHVTDNSRRRVTVRNVLGPVGGQSLP
jgi:hypothetical protein